MKDRLITYGVLLVALLGAFGWAYMEGKAASNQDQLADQLASAQQDLEDYRENTAEVNKLAAKRREAAVRIQTVTKELIREVPVRVPADACPLPGGWRLQHDEAAAGTPPDPTAPSGADGDPVAAQEAAITVTENYGQYHDLADRHVRLQQYVRQQCLKERMK